MRGRLLGFGHKYHSRTFSQICAPICCTHLATISSVMKFIRHRPVRYIPYSYNSNHLNIGLEKSIRFHNHNHLILTGNKTHKSFFILHGDSLYTIYNYFLEVVLVVVVVYMEYTPRHQQLRF